MIQDTNNPKKFTADEGKIFQRIYNGFTNIEEPYIVGTTLILGKILVNEEGKELADPTDDLIEYYEEIDLPVQEEQQEEVNEE